MRADRVALIHCCSAYIVIQKNMLGRTQTDPTEDEKKDRLDKEYKSYAISKLNIEHFYWSNGKKPVRRG